MIKDKILNNQITKDEPDSVEKILAYFRDILVYIMLFN